MSIEAAVYFWVPIPAWRGKPISWLFAAQQRPCLLLPEARVSCALQRNLWLQHRPERIRNTPTKLVSASRSQKILVLVGLCSTLVLAPASAMLPCALKCI